LRILTVHEYYQQPGGEDTVFQAESEILRAAGHEVIAYTRDNDEIARYAVARHAALAAHTLWNRSSYDDIKRLIQRERPEIAHFHNTFPLISASGYYACHSAGIPVVQTLHNPRLMCPAATLYRNDSLCRDCVGKLLAWPGVFHACYRHSRLQTAVVASMLALHRMLGTWETQIDTYIASTEFYRGMMIEAGLPPKKITVKPHFVAHDPGPRDGRGDFALYIGRLAPEKGVHTLLDAWSGLTDVPLKIRGDGPLLPVVERAADPNFSNIQVLPRVQREEMATLIKGARFLVWPSLGYYETFGLVAIEAFSCGVPVIASGVGAMAEVVSHGRTGLHFAPGDAMDLTAKVKWAWTHPDEMEVMGHNARGEYEKKYTRGPNYCQLIEIYKEATNRSSAQDGSVPSHVHEGV